MNMNILELSEEEKKIIRKQHEDAIKNIRQKIKDKEDGLKVPQKSNEKK